MSVHGSCSPIAVLGNLARVFPAAVFPVITERKRKLRGDKALSRKLHRQCVRHFLYDKPRFFTIIRALKYLTAAYAVRRRTITLDVAHRAGFIAPGVVDKKLCVHPKQFVQRRIILKRTPRHITHCEHSVFGEFFRITAAYSPEIRNRRMLPEQLSVAFFVKLRNPRSVLVRGHFLRDYIHCNLRKIHISADARSRRYSRGNVNIAHNLPCKLMRGRFSRGKIIRRVNKNLVYRVNVNIFGGRVFQINFVDFRAVFNIMSHSRRRNDIIRHKPRIFLKFGVKTGLPRKHLSRRQAAARAVHLAHLLHNLEKPRPSRNPVSLQRRRNRKTYRLFRSAFVRDDKVCPKRVKPPFNALDRRVKRL